VLVALVLADIFRSVVLPRPATRLLRLSPLLSRMVWYVVTRLKTNFSADFATSFLAGYASLMLVMFLVSWVVALILGYGLMFFGLRSEIAPRLATFGDALYFAGTTFLTIGFGDYHPVAAPAQTLAVVAGATGFAVIAVVATFLFSILAGFQQREYFIATVAQRVDATPTGLSLLLTIDRAHRYDDLTTLFRDARRWIAAVAESHLAYPVLTYFRSTREGDSWISTLAAVVDAAALIVSCVESEAETEALRTLTAGQRLIDTFTGYFEMNVVSEGARPSLSIGVIWSALHDAGYGVRAETISQRRYNGLRDSYRDKLDAMSRYWLLPALQWSEDTAVAAAANAAGSIAVEYGFEESVDPERSAPT